MSTSHAKSTDIADVCIVGAGLSGAYAAHTLLSAGKNVAVLDARHRIGGRLLTAKEQGGGDLGGAWVWPDSEPAMRRVLDELGVERVEMHLDGETMARTLDGRRHVLPPGQAARYAACGDGAIRVSGGAASMVEKLLQLNDNQHLSIQLNTRVVRIEHDKDTIRVVGTKSQPNRDGKTITMNCRAAILAAPPKVLAGTIKFHPPLPKVKIDSMLATPTWMEDYGKVSVSFPQNWWRTLDMSAISIDQIGAVSTWWEACSGRDGDGSKPTLAGFVTAHGAELLSKMETAEVHDHVIDSLQKLYGVDASKMGAQNDINSVEVSGSADRDGLVIAKGGITVTYKSWLRDAYTNVGDSEQCDFTTDYGGKYLQQSVGPLFFAGTETALGSGHMEGAIVAAQRVADEVLAYLSSQY